ncbi:MAG: SDR family oxidoreductase [Gemmatimonadetes bacterium]|nr:SDR family oxidoreductase [Gemmatimonadota bacterium]
MNVTQPSSDPLQATVLVTGGAGFIGHHLVRRLLDDGRTVRVVDDLSTGDLARLAPVLDRIEFVEGSIAEPEVSTAVCRDVGIVFHLAAIPSVARSVADPVGTHRANLTGTLVLLEEARRVGVHRLVYAGSSSAYGNTPELPKRESQTPNPMSPYAVSKLAGELYCRVYAHLHELETVVLRYFNVFGPGQDPKSLYSAVIPIFITRALAGEAPTIYGDGEQTRDFTYVDNVVEANLLAAGGPSASVSGKVFNVGCGDRISVNTLWEEIRSLTGASVEARYGPVRPGDVRHSLAELTAIRGALGYRGEIGLREGLRRTVEWFRGEAS